VLETQESSDIIARIQMEQSDDDDLSDGIKVDRTNYGFLIHINNEAYWRICDTPLSGTRYDGSNKIHFIKD